MNTTLINKTDRSRLLSVGHLYMLLFAIIFLMPVTCAAGIFFNDVDSSHPKNIVQFIFCSDVHFGISKDIFRQRKDCSAAVVNAAMVGQMNDLPTHKLPADSGVNALKKVGNIDAIIITGDIANRQESGVQSATISWKQFEQVYISGIQLKNDAGSKTPLWLTPGNHDISDAIGFRRAMKPRTDNASMVGMYNLMMQPTIPKTAKTFKNSSDKIHYSKTIGNIHLVFVSAWPDSAERIWMETDLKDIPPDQRVLIFTHSMPAVEARFFTNPAPDHSINKHDKFENLVEEVFKDGNSTELPALIEQRGLVAFIQAHTNIKGFFHGHTNYTEFYNWRGPDNNISLPCFRVDSPMKGQFSSDDESKLSFQLITIDTDKNKMTVRECFWNAKPTNTGSDIEWGQTISLDL